LVGISYLVAAGCWLLVACCLVLLAVLDFLFMFGLLFAFSIYRLLTLSQNILYPTVQADCTIPEPHVENA